MKKQQHISSLVCRCAAEAERHEAANRNLEERLKSEKTISEMKISNLELKVTGLKATVQKKVWTFSDLIIIWFHF